MAIDEEWEVKLDYTTTYTVTVDELKATAAAQQNNFGGRFKRRHHPFTT